MIDERAAFYTLSRGKSTHSVQDLQNMPRFAPQKKIFYHKDSVRGEKVAYEKRLCILKQVKKGFSVDGSELSGAVYAERLNREVIITPKIQALAPLKEGRYALALWLSGNAYCLELKGNTPLRIPDVDSIKDGFSVLLCFVKGTAEPLAFGFCGSAPNGYEPLLRLFEKRDYTQNTQEVQENDDANQGKNEAVLAADREETAEKSTPERYDDEAIADADYFGGVWTAVEDEGASSQDSGEEPAQAEGSCSCADETASAVHPFKLGRGGLAYYHEIAPKLKAAMQKYPRDETLKSVFPHSDWVKAENALLGIVYAEGVPRYLCVAMRSEPPKEVEQYSIFVPESPFTETEGYYIVFQDADSGEYVRMEQS